MCRLFLERNEQKKKNTYFLCCHNMLTFHACITCRSFSFNVNKVRMVFVYSFHFIRMFGGESNNIFTNKQVREKKMKWNEMFHICEIKIFKTAKWETEVNEMCQKECIQSHTKMPHCFIKMTSIRAKWTRKLKKMLFRSLSKLFEIEFFFYFLLIFNKLHSFIHNYNCIHVHLFYMVSIKIKTKQKILNEREFNIVFNDSIKFNTIENFVSY